MTDERLLEVDFLLGYISLDSVPEKNMLPDNLKNFANEILCVDLFTILVGTNASGWKLTSKAVERGRYDQTPPPFFLWTSVCDLRR